MVILVTGGAGFIGSHVVDRLIERGYSVRIFDKSKPKREDVEWYQGDLQHNRDILEACTDVEAVFHLAAVADVNVALSHPALCLQVNEIGTSNLLRAATAKEVGRVILASTTWVYGKTEGIVDEETPLPPPDHIYTKTKIGQEHLLITWQNHYGLPYTILRYGIPYGPRMRSNMAVAIFVRKAMRREPITVFGDGTQGRCFIYVEDLAEANVASLAKDGANEIFNVAGAEFITINQVVENLKKIFKNITIEYKTEAPEYFKGSKINIEKAKKLLRWQPKTPFQMGLSKYVKSWKRASQENLH